LVPVEMVVQVLLHPDRRAAGVVVAVRLLSLSQPHQFPVLWQLRLVPVLTHLVRFVQQLRVVQVVLLHRVLSEVGAEQVQVGHLM
jgi:hypothetical protein